MSCNPAIGGLGKGHMVREIDALGGFMGLNTDATAIQWRLLNSGRGPSVQAPRAQCDKKAYQFRAKAEIEADKNIDLHQGSANEILVKADRVRGVVTSLQMEISGSSVIVSAGTFMKALMHVGLQNQKGGRMGDGISTVSDSLAELGFEIDRFKTGTPCRLNGRSIDFSKCERQEGDTPPILFSFEAQNILAGPDDQFTLNSWGDQAFHVEQVPCWHTWTNENTHQIIRNNLDQSPMYSGKIEGVGPRYCPSIEDKVVRFAEKSRHQIFLEPEGRHTLEYYINGVSTSLPTESNSPLSGVSRVSRMQRSFDQVTPWSMTTVHPPSSPPPSKQNWWRASTLPAKSMAPPDTRKLLDRGSSPAPTQHSKCKAGHLSSSGGTKLT